MLLGECPRCACDSLVTRRIRTNTQSIVDPHQICECDVHPDCGWAEERTDAKRTRLPSQPIRSQGDRLVEQSLAYNWKDALFAERRVHGTGMGELAQAFGTSKRTIHALLKEVGLNGVDDRAGKVRKNRPTTT